MRPRSRFVFVVVLLAIAAASSPTDADHHAASAPAGRSCVIMSMSPNSSGCTAAGSPLCLCCGDLRKMVAAWLVGGRFELERAMGELRAAGIKTSLKDIAPPSIPDEENAALVYERAWDALPRPFQGPPPDVVDVGRSLRKTPIAQWPKDEKRNLADYIASQRDAIDLTLKATRYEKCGFALDFSQGYAMLMPHLAKMRSLARLLALDATAKLGDGDIEGAIESSLAMQSIGSHTGSDPTLISKLVEFAAHKVAENALEAILKLAYPTAEQLEGLLARLDEETPDTSLRDALATEMAAGLDAYTQIRTGQLSLPEMAAYVSPTPRGEIEWLLTMLTWGWIADRDQAMYIDTMLQYIELADKPYFEVKAAIEDLLSREGEVRQWVSPLSEIITPALVNAFAAASAAEAEYAVQRLAVALMVFEQERGDFPDRLDELVPGVIPEMPIDPFSGKPYVYRREDGRFLVYSLDRNMVDDNGTPSSEVGRDEGDIVFRFAPKP